MKHEFDGNQPTTHIWVIDDDPDCCMLIRDALVSVEREWDVNDINDSAAALAALHSAAEQASSRPDIILLDVNMPHGSGLDVLAGIREDPLLADIPVVMLTATTDPAIQARAMELGAQQFCSKPMSADAFRRVVVTAVKHSLRVVRKGQFNPGAWREGKVDEQ